MLRTTSNIALFVDARFIASEVNMRARQSRAEATPPGIILLPNDNYAHGVIQKGLELLLEQDQSAGGDA